MILLSLFLGSDYSLGIKGIGIVNSMEIVNTFNNYERLFEFKEWAIYDDYLLPH
jgi:DNA excision repair protein ERCC-5